MINNKLFNLINNKKKIHQLKLYKQKKKVNKISKIN